MSKLSIPLFAAFLAAGCTSAHVVKMEGDGGIVAIRSNSNVWPTYERDHAMELIRSHVGNDFEIVKQEEIVTGQYTTNNQNVQQVPVQDPVIPFLQRKETVVTSTQTTHDLKEFYIYYRKLPPRAGGATQPVVPVTATAPKMDASAKPFPTAGLTGSGVHTLDYTKQP